jgi:hypothetical protein
MLRFFRSNLLKASFRGLCAALLAIVLVLPA